MVLTRNLTRRIRFPAELAFVLAAPLLWIAFYNLRFWQETAAAMWHPSMVSVLFMASLFILVLFVQTLLLLFMPRRLLRPIACVLFIVAALVAYFSDTYGVFMDKDMLRNVFATDTAEVSGLITGKLFAYLLLLGVVPCLLIFRVELPDISWKRRLKERSVFVVSVLAVCLASLFVLSAAYASFFREHKPVRYLLNPASAVYGVVNLLVSEAEGKPGELVDVLGPVTRVGQGHNQGHNQGRNGFVPIALGHEAIAHEAIAHEAAVRKPIVLFLVIGETARAANFQLGGYGRATNPELSRLDDLIYFRKTSSCGTATATSLPCIFSVDGRTDFDVDSAKRQTNLLDALARAGLAVEWRDNNSGCKGVCARVRTIEYTSKGDSSLCRASWCYDEDMLSGVADELRNLRQDTVIVFHQVGSHGPAYSQRYPPQFERFKPACHSSQLDRCSRESVVNAYDNTILYTDHNLAQQIQLLRDVSDKVDGLLIYVSDHGESLGENGVYLHGMPYALAPAVQKEVPFMMWLSRAYERRTGVTASCLRSRAGAEYSHDNIFHTVMGAMGVRSPVYQQSLDMFAACAGTVTMASTTATLALRSK